MSWLEYEKAKEGWELLQRGEYLLECDEMHNGNQILVWQLDTGYSTSEC